MRTRYDASKGTDTFVAAFAQTNEGDASPNIFILDHDDWTHVRPTESMLGVFWAGRFENQLGLKTSKAEVYARLVEEWCRRRTDEPPRRGD